MQTLRQTLVIAIYGAARLETLTTFYLSHGKDQHCL